MENAFLKDAMLVFDLDGTLIDTAPDLHRTLNFVLTSRGYPEQTLDYVRPFISFGSRRMIVEGLANAGHEADDETIGEMFAAFLDHYGENSAVESRPYPGVADFLKTARYSGATLAVCTNKIERLTLILLEELNLLDRFHAVAGRDTFPVCKPDPAHLTGVVERAGGDLGRTVMIGDSATDINTAKAAGIPSIAVSFGYTDRPARDLGADAVVDHYDELPAALKAVLQG